MHIHTGVWAEMASNLKSVLGLQVRKLHHLSSGIDNTISGKHSGKNSGDSGCSKLTGLPKIISPAMNQTLQAGPWPTRGPVVPHTCSTPSGIPHARVTPTLHRGAPDGAEPRC